MTCPQCNSHIPAKSLWTSSGLSGVICPHCHASLCPKAMCAVVLFVLSFGLGNAALFFLRREGAELWLAFLGFFVVFAGVYLVIAPMILRLRLKEHAGTVHLTGHGV